MKKDRADYPVVHFVDDVRSKFTHAWCQRFIKNSMKSTDIPELVTCTFCRDKLKINPKEQPKVTI